MMNLLSKNDYLALDFDGVISDSILECLVTAFNAFAEYSGRGETRTEITAFSHVEIQNFREQRNYIRRGEDYVYLLLATELGIKIQNQSDFDSFSFSHDELRSKFRDLFYAQRESLQKTHLNDWLQLNPVYPGVVDLLQGRRRETTFIVTTKDLASVKLILEQAGVSLPISNLFQATKSYGKPTILKEIARHHTLNEDQLFFVDDHAATVMEVADQTKCNAYFAEWGYHSLDQLKLIEKQGIPTLTLDEFSAGIQLHKSAPPGAKD